MENFEWTDEIYEQSKIRIEGNGVRIWKPGLFKRKELHAWSLEIDKDSPNIQIRDAGTTYKGGSFIDSIITDKQNIKRIELVRPQKGISGFIYVYFNNKTTYVGDDYYKIDSWKCEADSLMGDIDAFCKIMKANGINIGLV